MGTRAVRDWLAFSLCLLLVLAGCAKAVEKAAVPPPAAPLRIELTGPHDADIPRGYRDRLLATAVSDPIAPQIFLAVADHFAAEGEEETALRCLDRAAGLFAGQRDSAGEALAFSRKALLAYYAGREGEALALLREGVERWNAPPLSAFPGYVAGRIALLGGDATAAREPLRQALRDNPDPRGDLSLLRLKRDTELAAGVAAVLAERLPALLGPYGRTARAGRRTAKEGEGSAHLREALALNGQLRLSRLGPILAERDLLGSEAEAYGFRGLDAGMEQGGAEAFSLLHTAAELADRAGFREGRIWSLLFLGELGFGAERRSDGLRAAETAKEVADRYRAAPYRIWARLLMARYYRAAGRVKDAIATLEEADAILTGQRPGPPAGMLDQITRPQRRALYEMLVSLSAGERRIDDALLAAQKAKALATADLLADADIGRGPREQELLGRLRELGRTITALQRRILRISGEARTAELLGRLGKAEEEYRGVVGGPEAEDRRLLALVAPRGIDGGAAQRLLDDNTTLFAYFVTETDLYVWAINRTALHLERVALTREGLRELVFSFLGAVRDKDRRKTEQLSRRAYDLLLKPVVPFVSGERIGFIPDDALAYLPFAALRYRGKFLVEGFSLFQLPGLGSLKQVRAAKESAGMRILALGDPDLENEALDLRRGAEELALIRKRAGRATVLLHGQASEAAAAGLTAAYDFYHFAVRGVCDPENPLRSGLLLTPGAGQDGILTVAEIAQLHAPRRAAILSGCDTVPEKDPEGRSLAALQRAFLAAGSPAVVSTLWYVEERAVSRLLETFYRQLERRKPLSAALRAAQLGMVREGQPPRVWAAFVLTGTY
ncbi:MAG: CHAT domain-containing protein [Syntrophales bacterium]